MSQQQVLVERKTTTHQQQQVQIELKDVEKTYTLGSQQVTALNGVNFSIRQSDFLAITGPSGSGKSTFLNLITLIDTPTKGKVMYNGVDVATLSDNEITRFRGQKVGIVFQQFNLLPVLSAIENVALALQIQQVPKKESMDRALVILKELGLGNFLDHRPDHLSGGQKQRVAIARALVTNPEIIIADEPTSALDSKTGLEIIALMKQLNETRKTTFVFSTHDPKVISQVHHVVELKDGRIVN